MKRKRSTPSDKIVAWYDKIFEKFVAQTPGSEGYAIRIKPELSVEENLDDIAAFFANVSIRTIIDPRGSWDGDRKVYDLLPIPKPKRRRNVRSS